MNDHAPSFLRRALAATLASLGLLVACGGGVSEQGTGSDLPTYANGPISGFGSIIVGGVHYDDSAARVVNEDGQTLSSGDLRLGMVVRIDGKNLDRTALTAVADTVTTVSEIVGPVTARDDVAGTLTVLDQTVSIVPAPAVDRAVAVGDVVEVYGLFDASRTRYAATAIQHRSPSTYKLHGLVSNLTASTFRIGGATIAFSTAPAGLANGAEMNVRLEKSRDGSGRWVLKSGENAQAPVPKDGTEVESEGVVTTYTSLSNFIVNGLKIDASSARIEPAGAVLAVGTRVEAEGTMSGGLLVASKVEVKQSDDDGGGGSGGGTGTEAEIESRITSLDTATKTFIVKAGAQKVDYAAARFKGGTEATLAVDVKVHVKGTLSPDGTVVVADEIEFDL